jgi:hypothetical protein
MPSNTLVSASHYTLRASKGAFSSEYGRRMAKDTESLRSSLVGDFCEHRLKNSSPGRPRVNTGLVERQAS